jgi:hypothetical protein
MHPEQPPRRAPVIDRVLPEPELTSGDDAVLPPRQGSHFQIRVHKAAHMAAKCTGI